MVKKYKVMNANQVKELISVAKERVIEWHRLKPEYIFLTETSATPAGYLFKEAWKKVYPAEKMPAFYRIDPLALPDENNGAGVSKKYIENNPLYLQRLDSFFRKRIKKKNARVLVFDENGDTGRSTNLVSQAIKNYLEKTSDKSLIVSGMGEFRNRYSSGRGWKKTNFIIIDKGKLHPYMSNTSGVVQELSGFGGYGGITKKLRGIKQVLRDGRRYEDFSHEKINFRGKVRKSKEGVFYNSSVKPLDYIHDLKQAGAEAGQELKKELQKKSKNLEHRLETSIVISLLGSMFFLSPNITGNVIGNLNQTSSNYIGVTLFILGLIASFAYFKRR